ncbi:MAG TPA: PilZ domain-containing protein [Acidobacteriaceae bacterium]|nr:PilZ domain-containing protein [Acidobacteriaceae bacterium]
MKDGGPDKQFWRKLLGRERRKAERRAALGLVAHYWDGGPPVSHSIRAISLTGMYLLTEERWHVGTIVMMTLQRMDSNQGDPGHSIAVHARAVHWGADGVGMAFLTPAHNPYQNSIASRDHGVNRKSMERLIR